MIWNLLKFFLRRVSLKQFGKKAETAVEGSSVSVYFNK